MCIVIDASAYSVVFNKENSNHIGFRPVLDWLINGRGKIIYGGSKYKTELTNSIRYLKLFSEFDRRGKVVNLSDDEVDRKEIELKSNHNLSQFNDVHIVAIIIISRAKLVCSCDIPSYRLFRMNELYESPMRKPKIYSGRRNNDDLLCDRNIVEICK